MAIDLIEQIALHFYTTDNLNIVEPVGHQFFHVLVCPYCIMTNLLLKGHKNIVIYLTPNIWLRAINSFCFVHC